MLPPAPNSKSTPFTTIHKLLLTDFALSTDEKPPSPLARFQNRVMKIEQRLDENIGLNNKRVWPKSDSK